MIRINDDTPGNGDGSFNFRIKVWKSSIVLPPPIPAIPVVCQSIANNLEGLQNEMQELQNELSTAVGQAKAAIVVQIHTLSQKINQTRLQLDDCINKNKIS